MGIATKRSFRSKISSAASSMVDSLLTALICIAAIFTLGGGCYIWYGTSWAVKELNANYLGQCVNVGGSAVGRVIWIAPAISRGGPFMSLDENYRPVARGKVRVAIGDTVGLYDAGSLTLTACPVAS